MRLQLLKRGIQSCKQGVGGKWGSRRPCRNAVSNGWTSHPQVPRQSSKSRAQRETPRSPANATDDATR